ncbi:MAG: phenylacetate--CoA ligase family protein [Solirubrobacteraceae bacterium]
MSLSQTAYLARQLPGQASFPFEPSVTVQRAQQRRLARIVAHAHATVPYYRDTMRRLGLTPQDFRTSADLSLLPMLDREEIQRDPEYFVSRSQPIDRYLRLRTGGSGGAPRQIFYDTSSVIEYGAYAERHRSIVRKLAGRRLRYREAIIESPFGTARAMHDFLARHVAIAPRLAIPRLYLSLFDPPDRNVALLDAFRPDVIDGYGSYLELLFAHISSTGRKFGWPRVTVYGSDAMSTAARRLITESMGLPVLSTYGAVEALQIGFECEQGLGYHLNLDLVALRVVGPNEQEQSADETGEVVISNLVNRATVLLNYRLGDVAYLHPFGCPCGRSLPLLSFIEGRTDDWIEMPSGEKLHPQAVRTLFTDEAEIYQYRVRQLGPGRFDTDVVIKDGIDREKVRARLTDKFLSRLGRGTKVRVFFVDAVQRTQGGKVRVVARSPSPGG